MNHRSCLCLFFAAVVMFVFVTPATAAERNADGPPQKETSSYVLAKKSARIWIEGAARLRFVHRDDQLTAALLGNRRGNGDSTTYADPDLTLGLTIKAKKQIYGHITLRTPLWQADYIGTSPRDLDADGNPDVSNRPVEVDEVYAELREFLFASSTMKMGLAIGLKNIAYSLKKGGEDGRSFFLNIGQSESPFAGAWPNTLTPSNRTLELTGSETLRGTSEFGGAILSLDLLRDGKKRGGTHIDFGLGTLEETGVANTDRDMMFLWLTKEWPERAKAQAYLVSFSNTPSSRIWTLGGGIDYNISDRFAFFSEVAFQGGMFQKNNTNQVGLVGPGYRESIRQLAAGGYIGFRYTHKARRARGVDPRYVGWRPFVEVKYWGLTGDSDQDNRRQQNFLSFEDWDEYIVMESDEYGFDVDTNVEALKISAGFKPYKDMELIFQYGNFVRAADKTAGDQLGHEVDLKLSWKPDESVSFETGVGTLLHSVFLRNTRPMTAAYFSVEVKF